MSKDLFVTCILFFALLAAACSRAPSAEEPMASEEESKPAAVEPTPAAQEEPDAGNRSADGDRMRKQL